MNVIRGLCLALSVGATACVGAVHPIVSEDHALFEPSLVGAWTDSASKERAVITQDGARGYAIAYTDEDGATVLLHGTLGRSPSGYLLDVQPTAEALGAYKDLVVRLHIPVMLGAIGTRMQLALLEGDSLERYLERNTNAVRHGKMKDGLLLTDETPNLERFFAEYLKRPGVLATPTTWTRRSP